MQYILLETDDGRRVYQCVQAGFVVAYKDEAGNTLESIGGNRVIDANPPTPSWHVDPAPQEQPQPVAQSQRVITKLDYMNRFHDDELAALYTAAKADVRIEIWLEKFKLAEFIDLNDARTAAGVQALEVAGLIGEGRANEILA